MHRDEGEGVIIKVMLLLQLSIYCGAFYICALGEEPWNSGIPFLLGSIAFSGFFTYEICRKLDPTLPEVISSQ